VYPLPIFAGSSQPFENHRAALRHPDVAVRAMRMAGGHDMLFERRPAQIVASVGIGEDSGAFR
jgi:hypothetical protein